jgi:hypothetical protein
MKCACGSSLSSVLAVVGLIGLGAAGYNTIRTGCPLGTCAEPSAAATAVSTPAGGAAVVGAGMMDDGSGLSCCERKARGEKQDCCPDEESPTATEAAKPQAPAADKPAA